MESERTYEPIENTSASIVEKYGLEVEGNQVDARGLENELVLRLLNELADTGRFVFHGTNSTMVFEKLEARQANDATGNKKAVYADAGITAPMASAIWNKNYIRTKFKSYVTGWSNNKSDKMTFMFSPNVYELIKNKDENIYSDGFIYVLNKENFQNAHDAGAEWHAEIDQVPVLAIGVSKKLADTVFSEDNVREYTPEEMNKIQNFNSAKKFQNE
jgi:hypothetical protein